MCARTRTCTRGQQQLESMLNHRSTAASNGCSTQRIATKRTRATAHQCITMHNTAQSDYCGTANINTTSEVDAIKAKACKYRIRVSKEKPRQYHSHAHRSRSWIFGAASNCCARPAARSVALIQASKSNMYAYLEKKKKNNFSSTIRHCSSFHRFGTKPKRP